MTLGKCKHVNISSLYHIETLTHYRSGFTVNRRFNIISTIYTSNGDYPYVEPARPPTPPPCPLSGSDFRRRSDVRHLFSNLDLFPIIQIFLIRCRRIKFDNIVRLVAVSAAGHKSLAPGFKSQPGYVWMVFQLSLPLLLYLRRPSFSFLCL